MHESVRPVDQEAGVGKGGAHRAARAVLSVGRGLPVGGRGFVQAAAQLALVLYTGYNLVTGKPRDVYGPMSIVGASRAAGEIASTNQIDPAAKVASLFTVLGAVNLFVALFNFVPLLPLDGGHVAAAFYEAVRRAIARLFGRPDPGPVDTARLLPVAYVVGGLILISGVVLILADLIDPIRLF